MYQGRVYPILFDSGWSIETDVYGIMKQIGVNPFYNAGEEADLPYDSAFYVPNAGGLVGRTRRRYQLVPLNRPSLESVHPTYRDDLSAPDIPMLEIIEIAPAYP